MSDLKDYSAQHAANLRARIEQLEAALRASQAAMKSAFADPDELKFSVKSMDRFAECIANNRVILGDTQ